MTHKDNVLWILKYNRGFLSVEEVCEQVNRDFHSNVSFNDVRVYLNKLFKSGLIEKTERREDRTKLYKYVNPLLKILLKLHSEGLMPSKAMFGDLGLQVFISRIIKDELRPYLEDVIMDIKIKNEELIVNE